MRKIDAKYDNPIDNVLIDISNLLSPMFRSAKFSANGITTLSLVFGILSIVFLVQGNLVGFGVMYFISYFFDCMDGFYARKYNMVSSYGDLYDHVKDVAIFAGILIVLYIRNRNCSWKIVILPISLFFLFSLLMIVHIGCQEKICQNEKNNILHKSKRFCPGNARRNIRISRFFGCGTFTIIFILVVVMIEKSNVCK